MPIKGFFLQMTVIRRPTTVITCLQMTRSGQRPYSVICKHVITVVGRRTLAAEDFSNEDRQVQPVLKLEAGELAPMRV